MRSRKFQAAERRLAAPRADGVDVRSDENHQKAFHFRDPDGQEIELYYETERYEAPTKLRPALRKQAQRYPVRGAIVRWLDHFNRLAVSPRNCREFVRRDPDLRCTERSELDDGHQQIRRPRV